MFLVMKSQGEALVIGGVHYQEIPCFVVTTVESSDVFAEPHISYIRPLGSITICLGLA